MTMKEDPERTHLPETGIYIRGELAAGGWGAIDLNHLTKSSLLLWLFEAEGDRPVQVILHLLGHKPSEP